MPDLTHGSCFSGIGGFGLAARWAGIETHWQIEYDAYCRMVLDRHFPNAKKYKDIKEVDPNGLEPVDIISGGFPCQPFSVAGKRLGKKDDRYLWPKMLEIIRIVKPAYALCENVFGIIGLALDQTLSDLETSGYACETFVIPDCALDAPHRRDRVWILAHTGCQHIHPPDIESRINKEEIEKAVKMWQSVQFVHRGTNQVEFRKADGTILCRNADGLPHELDRLKALGNAIVPQVAHLFFTAIKAMEEKKEETR